MDIPCNSEWQCRILSLKGKVFFKKYFSKTPGYALNTLHIMSVRYCPITTTKKSLTIDQYLNYHHHLPLVVGRFSPQEGSPHVVSLLASVFASPCITFTQVLFYPLVFLCLAIFFFVIGFLHFSHSSLSTFSSNGPSSSTITPPPLILQ